MNREVIGSLATSQSKLFCFESREQALFSISYEDLHISLIPLRYYVVVKPCRDNIGYRDQAFILKLKVITLYIEISRSRLPIIHPIVPTSK